MSCSLETFVGFLQDPPPWTSLTILINHYHTVDGQKDLEIGEAGLHTLAPHSIPQIIQPHFCTPALLTFPDEGPWEVTRPFTRVSSKSRAGASNSLTAVRSLEGLPWHVYPGSHLQALHDVAD